jgi:ribose transport system ATP-binding protein
MTNAATPAMPAGGTSAETILELRKLRKTFPAVVALDNVDFDVRRGEVHALLGANGAGKSTLIKIVAGLYRADAGEIRIAGSPVELRDPHAAQALGVSVIYQDFALALNLTVAENLFLGRELMTRFGLVDWRRTHREARRLLDRLGIDIPTTMRVSKLSTGQRQLVEIAKALGIEAKLLVLDEPTASLSRGEAEKLFDLIRRLARSGVGIIYVSHRLEEIAPLATRVTVLRDGRSVGTYTVDQLDRAGVVALITGHEWRSPERPQRAAAPSGEPLLELRSLSRAGEFEDISLRVCRGEILALTGLIGAGRTELLETIFGARRVGAGEIRISGRVVTFARPRDAISSGVALIPEDRRGQGLALIMPVAANMTLAALGRFISGLLLQPRHELQHVRRMIAELAIKTAGPLQAAALLSGGNQQKLVLAKWLSTSAELFLLDEPTQGVDVDTKDEIYRLMRDLAATGKAVLVASSDLEEVLEVGDRILAMRRGRIVGEFRGDSIEPARLVDAITHGQAA